MRSQNPQSIVRSRERCRNNKNERCLKRTSLGDRVINNLDLIHAVGMVDGMPRAGSHYNLGTSRGPDKIGSLAGPRPRAVSCTWLLYSKFEIVTVIYFSE